MQRLLKEDGVMNEGDLTCGKKEISRRSFVEVAAAAVGVALAAGCGANTEPEARVGESTSGGSPNRPAPAFLPGVPRETVLDLADSTARARIAVCHHCAQSTFLALEEVFGLEGGPIVKALTPLPGIAERGETCGAVTGSLMAMGLLFGRDRLDDFPAWRRSLVPTRRFCEQFEAAFGSTMCRRVVDRQFGQPYDLYDPDDLAAFQAADATEKCGEVVGTAARLAAAVILDEMERG
jgi:C_GCAxxG_C_C family probable redox protein